MADKLLQVAVWITLLVLMVALFPFFVVAVGFVFVSFAKYIVWVIQLFGF